MPQDEPEEEAKPVTVRHLAGLGEMIVDEFLDSPKARYPFYGVLLPSPAESQVNAYIRRNWDQLHAMSGSACLLVTPLAPEHMSAAAQKFLTDLVGEEKAQRALQSSQATPEEQATRAYTLAQQSHIDYDKLPCLLLMSDLAAKKQVLQRLPLWDEESLRHFFEALFTKINHHSAEPDPHKRLAALKSDLGPGFMAGLQAGRAARGARDGLAEIKWSEVLEFVVANRELIGAALKFTLSLFGVSAGG
jgi:hypothetical protein